MNFRQRVAWLCLAVYLTSSVAAVYYFLDIADQFAMYSLEHSKLHDATNTSVPLWKFWHHIGDLPFHIFILLIAIPYLQIFATLFYCTLSHVDKNVNKCIIPIIGWIYLFRRMCSLFCNRDAADVHRRESLQLASVS